MIVDDFMNEDITKDIMIEDKLTSSIIGTKGSRIKTVRNNTHAKIIIAEDSAVVDGKRKITVSGTMKEVMWAVNAVRTLIKDAEEEAREHGQMDTRDVRVSRDLSHSELPRNRFFEMALDYATFTPSNDQSNDKISREVKIPTKKAGLVLGRKACVVNEIKKLSRCLVQVEKECDPGTEDRTVTITGIPRDVHIAEFMVGAVQHMPQDVAQRLGLF